MIAFYNCIGNTCDMHVYVHSLGREHSCAPPICSCHPPVHRKKSLPTHPHMSESSYISLHFSPISILPCHFNSPFSESFINYLDSPLAKENDLLLLCQFLLALPLRVINSTNQIQNFHLKFKFHLPEINTL